MKSRSDTFVQLSPERRLALRVPVNRTVRVAVGLRTCQALLVDLSLIGCRLRCPEPVTAHGSVWVMLPGGLGGRFPFPVRGEVARAESVPGEPTGSCDVALRFREIGPRVYERLCAALGELLEPPSPDGERRRSLRRWFGRPVIARAKGRPRVVLGRGLSSGGMLVDGAAGLDPGDEIQIALHSHAGEVPLVLRARVVRAMEDGSAALAFVDPTPGDSIYLEKLVGSLGACDAHPVVSEILEPSPSLAG